MNKKHIVILAGSPSIDYTHAREIIDTADLVICADGGANHARDLEIVPDIIIGDLDSITEENKRYYSEQPTRIIEDGDQGKTDLTLAIAQALLKEPTSMTILAALDGRFDHALANLNSLGMIPGGIPTSIQDKDNTIQLLDRPTKIYGDVGDMVSIIPLTPVKSLTTTGLRWDLTDLSTPRYWYSVSNRFSQTCVTIDFSEGSVLLIRPRIHEDTENIKC